MPTITERSCFSNGVAARLPTGNAPEVGNRCQENEGPAWGSGTLACAQPFENGARPDLRIGGVSAGEP